MRAVDIINRKRDGNELSTEEINWFIEGYTRGDIPDYQAAAWLMTVVWRGMRLAWVREDRKEDLMAALRRLGDRLAKQDVSQEISGEHAAVAKPRVWVGATAKEGLMAAFGAAPPVARFAAVSARPRG